MELGAFLWNWLWGLCNGTFIALLSLVPYLGFIMIIVLGIKGNEWAWRNKKWESIEHFKSVQKKWSVWGILIGGVFLLGILAAIIVSLVFKAGR